MYFKNNPILLRKQLLVAVILLGAFFQHLSAQEETGHRLRIANPVNQTLTEIDLPMALKDWDLTKKTTLIFYALPNGNSIEWTRGRKTGPDDDWHYDIQHIAAQTAYLRQVIHDQHIVVAYMANNLKSWPAWKKQQPNGPAEIKRIVDSITGMFERFRPNVILNSHSGGGSFIFGYLDAVTAIPDQIKRISFIDSNYGYEDSLHGNKLIQWLSSSSKHYLNVLAYNDSVVVYNGKPLVSATGGTWYRSQMLQRKLAETFRFTITKDTSLIHYSSTSNRTDIYLKTNKEGKIYHTEQVARNGFIHTIISGTKYQKKAGYQYWGDRVYEAFIRP